MVGNACCCAWYKRQNGGEENDLVVFSGDLRPLEGASGHDGWGEREAGELILALVRWFAEGLGGARKVTRRPLATSVSVGLLRNSAAFVVAVVVERVGDGQRCMRRRRLSVGGGGCVGPSNRSTRM